MLVYATAIPAGQAQALQTLHPSPPPPLQASLDVLENTWLRVEFAQGMVQQIYDKRRQTKLLQAPISYQFFRDQGQYWDAWNIDPNYADYLLEGWQVEALELLET
ncbi:MAG: hypothetical protein HC926_02420, partial [Synechococcaceae cyanobacterium SM2_3_60]|nr:hypothetical protein [Synechococcaceae cyanobacterium SM2_3_60]